MSVRRSLFSLNNKKLWLWFAVVLFVFGTGYALYQPVHPDPWHAHNGWDKLIYPQEKNAFLRQPSISKNINDITAVESHLWAVGDGGLILHSADGGLCWEPKGPWLVSSGESSCNHQTTGLQRVFSGLSTNQETDALLDIVIPKAYAADAATPRQDTPQQVTPQKVTPNKATPAQPTLNLKQKLKKEPLKQEINSATQQNIELENNREDIPQDISQNIPEQAVKVDVGAKTNVKAAKELASDTSQFVKGFNGIPDLNAVVFFDAKHGVAVGNQGVIIKTNDGGLSWNFVDSGTESALTSIVVLDGDAIIVVGANGTVLRSSNAGLTWQSINSGMESIFTSIAVLDGDTIIAVGRDNFGGSAGIMMRSSDAGLTWQSINSGTTKSLTSVAVLNGDTIIAVGMYGTVLRSSDAGLSWQPIDSGTKSTLTSIAVLGSDTIIAVGEDYRGPVATILRSSDAGLSWQSINSGTSKSLTSIAVLDSDTIIAVGRGGTDNIILRSSDAGLSWQPIDSGTTTWLTSITALDGDTIIAVGRGGTVLRSSDAGLSWQPINSGTTTWLTSITALDGDTIIAVGRSNTVLRSSNAGLSWQSINSGTTKSLTSIAVLDGDTIIAVGGGGTVLRSSDAGLSWQSINSGTTTWLTSIAALDSDTIITVGNGTAGDTILRSGDAGLSWQSLNQYAVNLAYWWYLFTAIIIGLVLLIVWPRIEQAEDDGIAGLAASDRPLQPGEPDTLNLSGIAADITTFLSNPKTTAPLTMAITGPWGCGKSSLMNLVQADLKNRGFSPVWFNAWHHQKGEQLLASLFAHIKQQAIPSWFSFDGLWFRLKLAYIRSYRHWFIFAILFGMLFFTISFYLQSINAFLLELSLLANPLQWWLFPWADYMPSIQNFFREGDWIQTLAGIFGIGTPLLALIRAARGFGINPRKLVSIDHASSSNKGYDPGARARFAREFSDVTRALGYNKMVIFIDDLDRCTQGNLIDILENINFISSSGDCFLVLGMAPKYIEACVANAYEKLAKSIAEKEKHDKELHKNNNHSENEETHKFRFAHNYLEKMINIEVAVPTMQSNSFNHLLNLQAAQIEKPDWISRLSSSVRNSSRSLNKLINVAIPILIISLAIGFAWDYGANIPDKPAQKDKPVYSLWPADKETVMALTQKQSGAFVAQKLQEDSLSTENVDTFNNFSIVLQADENQLKEGLKIATLGRGKNKADILLRLDKKQKNLEVIEKPPIETGAASTPTKNDNRNGQAAEFRQAAFEKGPRISGTGLLIAIIIFTSFCFYLYRKRKDKYAADSDDFKNALSAWTPWIQLKQETPRAVKRFLNHLRFLAIRNNKEMKEAELVAMASIYFFNKKWLLDDEAFYAINNGNLENLLATELGLDENKGERVDAFNGLLEQLQKPLDELKQAVGGYENVSTKREQVLSYLRGTVDNETPQADVNNG